MHWKTNNVILGVVEICKALIDIKQKISTIYLLASASLFIRQIMINVFDLVGH